MSNEEKTDLQKSFLELIDVVRTGCESEPSKPLSPYTPEELKRIIADDLEDNSYIDLEDNFTRAIESFPIGLNFSDEMIGTIEELFPDNTNKVLELLRNFIKSWWEETIIGNENSESDSFADKLDKEVTPEANEQIREMAENRADIIADKVWDYFRSIER